MTSFPLRTTYYTMRQQRGGAMRRRQKGYGGRIRQRGYGRRSRQHGYGIGQDILKVGKQMFSFLKPVAKKVGRDMLKETIKSAPSLIFSQNKADALKSTGHKVVNTGLKSARQSLFGQPRQSTKRRRRRRRVIGVKRH